MPTDYDIFDYLQQVLDGNEKPPRLIPVRRFEIETSLTPQEAMRLLGQRIDRMSRLEASESFASDEAPGSAGETGASALDFVLTSHGKDATPVTRFSVEPTPFGSRMKLVTRPRLPALILASVWMVLMLGAGIAVLVSVLFGSKEPTALLFLLVPLAGVALTSGTFAFQSAKIEKFLRDLFPPAGGPRNAGPYRAQVDMAEDGTPGSPE